MPRRNSPNDIQDLGELSRLTELVYDKRRGQRASAKKNRRNRHYEKQFIRNTLAHLPPAARNGADALQAVLRADDPCAVDESAGQAGVRPGEPAA